MAIIRNAANRKLVGRVGDTTYYVSLDRQVARQALNSSNYGETARRTNAQQNRRVRWANLVNFYKASKGWMPKAFETKSKRQTDYNRFMSVNIEGARIALTKNMAAMGACIADNFMISQGSLHSIAVQKHTDHWDTNIQLGDLTITDETTIAVFTQAVLAENTWIKNGDQISFVSYQQSLDALSVPHIICTAYEVTLDGTSTELLRTYLPEFAASTYADGVLATGKDISLGAFAYVLSRNSGSGSLLVSTQQLVTNNDALILQYSSQMAFEDAIASYGVDTDVFLETGSVPVSKAQQPLFVSYVDASGSIYKPNDFWDSKMSALTQAPTKVYLSAATNLNVVSVEILPAQEDGEVRDSSMKFTTGISHASGSQIINLDGSLFSEFYPTDYLYRLTIVLSDGSELTAQYKVSNHVHE